MYFGLGTDKQSEDVMLNGLMCSSTTMRGRRDSQEDSHVHDTFEYGGISGILLGVFDGHGGDYVAKQAARIIKPMFLLALRGADIHNPNAVAEAITKAFMLLDDNLRKLCSAIGDRSGATAIVAIIMDTYIIVANAGDSRCVLMTGDSTEPMSFDHKPSNEVEARRINAAGGYVSGGRVIGVLAVSRALGDFDFKENDSVPEKEQMVSASPDIKIVERDDTNNQFLLLGCDGIWDVMSNDEAGEYVKELVVGKYAGEPNSKILERFVDSCFRKGSTDNMTCVLIILPALTAGENVMPHAVMAEENIAEKRAAEKRAEAQHRENMKTHRLDTKTQRLF